MKAMFYLLSALLLCSCAATYVGPTAINTTSEATVSASKEKIFSAAQRALVADGNQILSADEKSGTITTQARDFRLTPAIADCGTTMGIDYLKDNRTQTKIAYGIIAEDNKFVVRTTLQGKYEPAGGTSQTITLSCVSRGELERQMMEKINANIR